MKQLIIQNESNIKFIKFYHLHRTPNVTTKELTENSSAATEFNPAYSFELTANPTQCEVDTFDHILQVTSHHEAVYAYYYKDVNNEVRIPSFIYQFGIIK